MLEDIKLFDSQPIQLAPKVRELEPLDLCTACGLDSCPNNKCTDVDWTRNGRRVKSCFEFIPRIAAALQWLLRCVQVLAVCLCVVQAEPGEPMWYIPLLLGVAVAAACAGADRAIERRRIAYRVTQLQRRMQEKQQRGA